MPDLRKTLALSPLLMVLRDEAEHLGVSFPALLTTDLARYRSLAEKAVPPLTDWEWGLLSRVLDGIEQLRILGGDDSLPSGGAVIAEIESWCDDATDDELLRAGMLARQIRDWPPLAIAGILIRLRSER